MVETLSPPQAPAGAPPQRRRRTLVGVVVGLVVIVLAAFGAVVVRGVAGSGRPVPEFASLAAQPDSSIHGSVAYFARGPAGQAGCVRVVSASGQPSKNVLCLPAPDMSKAAELGTKEDGPQLVWLPDGRLEVTMFRNDPKTDAFSMGWQKIVDVRTGHVLDVSGALAPPTPNLTTHPTTSPSGQRITTSSDESSGRIKVELTDTNGTRTLMSAHGPGEYTYRLRTAFWAPNFEWIAADDGRILVITPGDPPQTRVLVDGSRVQGLYGSDPGLASFAVTAADVFAVPPAPTPSTPSTPSTAPTAADVAKAQALVRSIYDPLAGQTEPPSGPSCFVTGGSCGDLDTHLTPELKQKLLDFAKAEDSDPILCAQNTPGRVSYDKPVISDGSVTIVVHTFYSGPPDQDNRIKVTVDPVTQKLTDLACLGGG